MLQSLSQMEMMMLKEIDIGLLNEWVGREEILEDVVTPFPVRGLRATFDSPYVTDRVSDGLELPPLWHWLYFLPVHRQSELGEDGHARKGGFLPPVPLPRRMWAGGRFGFLAPLRVGDHMQKKSRIESVQLKDGRSGPLVFVTVRHEISVQGEPKLWEEHDIVYRDLPQSDSKASGPKTERAGKWFRLIKPNDVLLFRYSALTFNGHRIHYDRQYVTGVEGYPGLIVHGPMIASLLIDLLLREMPDAKVHGFEFRAVRPTFDIHDFDLNGQLSEDGRTVHLWARDHEGFLTMDAIAQIS